MSLDLPVLEWPLPYVEQLGERNIDDIELVVIHCTELPDLAMARAYGEKVLYVDSGTGNSGHYYIDRDGKVVQFVPVERIAHHTRGFNPRSIGIELVNSGRYPNWLDSRHQQMTEPYTAAQLDALEQLLAGLQQRLPALRQIAGHEDLDTATEAASDDPAIQVRRKLDPGVHFPWSRFESIGLQRIPLRDRLP
jgi:N-acetylmuramoyl-L-alanine amidase